MGRTPARLLLCLLALYVAVLVLPRAPYERGPGYDRSFVLGLNAAHAQGVVFGPELVYPYGPLGWVCHPLPIGGALGLAFALQLALWAVLVGALLLLVRRVGGGWTAAWCLAVVAAAGLVDPLAQWLVNLEYLAVVLGLLAFAAPAPRRLPALLALSVLAAALFLVKLDAGLHAAALCAGLALATAVRCRAESDGGALARRVLWAPPAAFLLALAALYALESRRLDTLPAFLRDSVPVLLGYQEMSVEGDPGRLLLMLSALAVAFLLLPALAGDRPRLTAALALVAVPAFLLWQRVSLRQDAGHQISLLPRLSALLLFPLLAAATRRDRVLVATLQLVLLVEGCVFVARLFPEYVTVQADRLAGRQTRQTVTALADWTAFRDELAAGSALLGAGMRIGGGAHAIVGRRTVDAVPWKLERVFAQGWSWRPRPALQDGNAYTPRLDRLDAEHFAGARAPDFVLADLDAIDDRHAFLEAPLGWCALLDRYDLRATLGDVLLLERRGAPRFAPLRRLASVESTWDEELAVPRSRELVLLAARIDPGLAGRAAGLLYRNAPVYLEVRYLDGREGRWRAVRPNLRSGALVNPLPSTLEGLRAVFEAGAGDGEGFDHVAAVRLHTKEPWQYGDVLTVEWWELPLAEGERPWRADLPSLASRWVALGDGCDEGAGGGRPLLRVSGEPRIGEGLELIVESAPPRRGVRLLIGTGRIEAPGPKGTLFVDPARMLVVPIETDGRGEGRLQITIPSQPRLASLELRVQLALPASDAVGVGNGDGTRWRLGCAVSLLIGR